MMESILSLVAFLLPIIIEGIKSYTERQKGGNVDANIQEFRKTLAKNDATARSALLADQHDRVLAATRGH